MKELNLQGIATVQKLPIFPDNVFIPLLRRPTDEEWQKLTENYTAEVIIWPLQEGESKMNELGLNSFQLVLILAVAKVTPPWKKIEYLSSRSSLKNH